MASYAQKLVKSIGTMKQTNSDILSVLGLGSEVLANIQRDFASLVQARIKTAASPMEITCFYEELPVLGVGMVILPFLEPMNSTDLRQNRLFHINRLHWTTGFRSVFTVITAI